MGPRRLRKYKLQAVVGEEDNLGILTPERYRKTRISRYPKNILFGNTGNYCGVIRKL